MTQLPDGECIIRIGGRDEKIPVIGSLAYVEIIFIVLWSTDFANIIYKYVITQN